MSESVPILFQILKVDEIAMCEKYALSVYANVYVYAFVSSSVFLSFRVKKIVLILYKYFFPYRFIPFLLQLQRYSRISIRVHASYVIRLILWGA